MKPFSDHMMKRLALIAILTVPALLSGAQNNNTYEFLNIPVSARAAALGGQNITIIENDFTMASQNPALLPCVSQRNISLSYMHYMKGVNIAAASYSSFINERLGWAVNAEYMGYGKMTRADMYGNQLGEFTAKDMAMSATFSYEFNDYWSGGVTGKFLYSGYDTYSSLGIGFDFGLNYYKEQTDFSFSIVARNLGAQLKHYTGGTKEKLPANLLIGISKRLAHAPLRLSVTMQELQNWRNSAINEANGTEQKFFNKLINKFVFARLYPHQEPLCRPGIQLQDSIRHDRKRLYPLGRPDIRSRDAHQEVPHRSLLRTLSRLGIIIHGQSLTLALSPTRARRPHHHPARRTQGLTTRSAASDAIGEIIVCHR